jgi:hypothetical protein
MCVCACVLRIDQHIITHFEFHGPGVSLAVIIFHCNCGAVVVAARC